MKHRDSARLRRSLAALTIGVVDAQRVRQRELAPLAASDMVQQVQVPISGKVGRTPTSEIIDVQWPHPFLTRVSKMRTTMPFDNPTFTTGIELKSLATVMVEVQVVDWLDDDSSFLTGARVKMIAWSPDAPKMATFSGTVHLTFFGYAAPITDDSEG